MVKICEMPSAYYLHMTFSYILLHIGIRVKYKVNKSGSIDFSTSLVVQEGLHANQMTCDNVLFGRGFI